jgi:hypothetical protein
MKNLIFLLIISVLLIEHIGASEVGDAVEKTITGALSLDKATLEGLK